MRRINENVYVIMAISKVHKTCFIFALFIFIHGQMQAQNWYKQVIRDEVTISFPAKPQHKILDEKGNETYFVKNDGCGYMVGVAPNAIKDCNTYFNVSDSEKVKLSLSTMEGVVKGKVEASKQQLISMNSFRSGKNVGMDIEYGTFNSNNSYSRRKYSTLILVECTLYIFDCWYLDDNDHAVEKDMFFKSILLKK